MEGKMSAYLIGKMSITDQARYDNYKRLTPDIVKAHGGRFISRGGQKFLLEGEAESRRVVIVEFPSVEAAQKFYNSEEYTKARYLREGAADEMQLFIVEGVDN
ncbi:hypothetical protein ALO43_100471 [Pseudomonas tremae]|uniref:DUF1330 domain-containing protein n=2 Tax=Pseudomonas TaxID=286 RepID=A0AA40TWJ4_9PSED|nr:hypothetical protein ALO43_100471 [Pseudomonas tremae]